MSPNERRFRHTAPQRAGGRVRPPVGLALMIAGLAIVLLCGAAPTTEPHQPQPKPALSLPKGPAAPTPQFHRPEPRPVPPDPNALTDEQIGQSIHKGAMWLLNKIDPKTHRIAGFEKVEGGEPAKDESLAGGLDALCVYSLMQCGLALKDEPRLSIKGPQIKAMVEAMRGIDLTKGHSQTYAHGLRATALTLYIANREQLKGSDDPDRKVLQEDARWGMYACDNGAYSYEMKQKAPAGDQALLQFYSRLAPGRMPFPEFDWDNSNSQYGVLGVWSAAEGGIEVPLEYWALVDHHWTNCQNSNGTWGYSKEERDSKLSMTAAGLASLLVTYDYLVPVELSGAVGRDPYSPAVRRGLEWFESGDNAIKIDGNWGYTLYGVERVGLASGYKEFGKHVWYPELAKWTIARQEPEGSWDNDPITTSYALLFLARGRHPIVMSKLRFGGFWNNRPHDMPNLARFTSRAVERPLNWQVVRSQSPWTEWTDAPVLCLCSHAAPKLSKEEIDKIRSFVEAGGMLFTQADGDSSQFNGFARTLAKELFGQELTTVPQNHPLLTAESLYNIKPAPPLKMVTNGSRILMLHSPKDITRWWQLRDDIRHKAEFQLGVNLFAYAGGKCDLRNRIDPAWVAPVAAPPLASIRVTRLKYAGNWDPEPGAWPRYANWFQRQTSYRIDLRATKMSDLQLGEASVAVLTGTARQNFAPSDAAAIRKFVDAGGALFIDMTGGTGQFEQNVRDLLHSAFPGVKSEPVPPTHPLLATRAHGMEDLTKRHLRATTLERVGRTGSPLEIFSSGKGHVIFSPIDVTSGLLGTDTAGIIGYDPHYAEALVKNLLFWTLDGQFDR